MKKILIVILLLLIGGNIGIIGYKYYASEINNHDSNDTEQENKYSFDTSYGTITIDADKALACQGTAGASNKIFYLKDNNLYYYVHEDEDELYAQNIDDIYYANNQDEQITVVTNKDTVILKESSYLNYLPFEKGEDSLEDFVFDTAYGEVKIRANYALACQGTAGASNKIFYLKNNNLYYYIHEGEDELYATNIKSILYLYDKDEQITVMTNDNTEILKTSSYLNYVSSETNTYTFSTAYGSVEIEAQNALTCRGTAGATNNIFYIKYNNLYYYVHEGEDELYAKNVDKMYYEKDQSESITIETNQYTNVIKEDKCLLYK